MDNKWSDARAEQFVAKYALKGVNSDLALRVYSSQLLGQEPKLVIHGGGNTSVKTTIEVLNSPIEVLCVKGSGWDLGNIEPEGLPAVKIAPLKDLLHLSNLSDEKMVNTQRVNLLDASAPNPSVETLLHAFLPHKFIDHTHSNAILALCNQPNGENLCREVFGNQIVYVPYIMPGFALAKKSKTCFDQSVKDNYEQPIGMVLLKHGLVSFGDSAKQAYERMIYLVNLAEKKIDVLKTHHLKQTKIKEQVPSPSEITPILRGLLAKVMSTNSSNPRRVVLEHRNNAMIEKYVNGTHLESYSQKGTVTPDHVIRIKQKPLILTCPAADKLPDWEAESNSRIKNYVENYKQYFIRNNLLLDNSKKQLDPCPTVILIPGLGLFAAGNSSNSAKVAADLGEVNAQVISDAEEIGTFECISEKDIFEIEHWSLEQAKLSKSREKPLQRQVVVITGGAGSIGAATAKAFADEGAEVVILDKSISNALKISKSINCTAIKCDVTEEKSIKSALSETCELFGGVDILVSNAGVASEGEIGNVSSKFLRESFEINFWSHQSVCQSVLKIMLKQKTGGCLLFNTSKQAINPGRNFGPYGLPKAATLFLMKQYALDHGKDGIRSNAVNADRIRSGILTDEFISSRASARGLDKKKYMSSNLLQQEVLSSDVAAAFVYLAKATKTSAATLTVDGGNIEASLR